MIRRGPNCCLLGHVTGLLFCLYVKIFLPSIFNLIDFWVCISLIVIDIEPTEKNIIKELGLFLMVLYKDFQFVSQRFLNLINRQHGTQIIYMELREVVENWNMRSCLLSFTTKKVMNADVFAKGLEKCRLLTRLLGQSFENLDDYGCPKKSRSCWRRKNEQFVVLL